MDNSNVGRIKHLLVKHLMGDLQDAEQKELDQWRALSESNEELYRRMSDSRYLEKRYADFTKAVHRSWENKGRKSGLWRWAIVSLAAAAAVLLVLFLPYFSKPEMKTFSAPQKGVASLVLPDGSKVWLKSASSITYPVKFSKKVREVSFTGEGYFEVVPKESEFTVSADGFKVKVTGTKFDIKSYRDDKRALTALIEGEVSIIYSDSLGVERQDRMVGGDLAVFDKKSRKNSIVKSNTSIYSAWIGGVYCFDTETLENILREVCRYYGYNLIISDSTVTQKVLSGRLKMEDDASEILDALRDFLPGHIKLESDTIIIQ